MGLVFTYAPGQTPLDEQEQDGLLLKTVQTQGELNELEQFNIQKAVEWTMRGKLTAEKVLTEKFVKTLHKRMYSEVWSWAGTFRKTDKNIGMGWTQIGISLKTLLDDTAYWVAHNTYPRDEVAIRFKHGLVAIHCFPNGNGRHSRLMADPC